MQKAPAWKAPVNNSLWMNFKRAFYCSTTALVLHHPIHHFWTQMSHLSHFYEWPANRTEANIFFRETFRLPNFWKELSKKLVFGTISYAGDIGPKLALWQFFYGGTWSPAEYADWNAFKYVFAAFMTAVPTCWTGIPFHMASRAYYADKSWPLEMRRGYTSPLNALLRIPFEEGPSYLFKGGLPIATFDGLFYSFFFAFYAWLKNKMFFWWVYNDFSYNYCKAIMMGMSWAMGTMVGYPAYFAREMVDLWPKERGGHCTWQNNYRVAITWAYHNSDILFTNFFGNYTAFMAKKGIPVFMSMWIADNLGMFSNVSDTILDFNQVFPGFLESA